MDRPADAAGMKSLTREDLRRARLGERDPRVRDRIAAANMFENMGMMREEIASALPMCPRRVTKWVGRYRRGGIEALRDLPRTGRPPRATRGETHGLVDRMREHITPIELFVQLRRVFDAEFHMSHVRKTMHRLGLSAKRPRPVHVNRAARRAVTAWQGKIRGQSARLRRRGHTVVVQDETIVARDAGGSPRRRAPVGTTANVPHTGSHERLVVHGALSLDGEQPFRTHGGLNADTFVDYLRELRRRFGKVAVVADRAPQHGAWAVEEFLSRNGDVELPWLPVGSPYLNAVEAWRQMKWAVACSEHCPTMRAMRKAVSRHLRVTRYALDVRAYLFRRLAITGTNL